MDTDGNVNNLDALSQWRLLPSTTRKKEATRLCAQRRPVRDVTELVGYIGAAARVATKADSTFAWPWLPLGGCLPAADLR